MKNKVLLLGCLLFANPVCAQLSRPIPGSVAPPAINYFRVAIIPKVTFKTEQAAKVAADLTLKDFPPDFFKYKITKLNNDYRIAMMVRIMFFDRDQAEAALKFLAENPQFNSEKYDLEVMRDSSY